MIARVDAYLEAILGDALSDEKVSVVFDSPPVDVATSRPTVNLLLFDIREELDRRGGSDEDVYRDGRRAGKRPPTRYYRLRYLLTAQAKTAREEHRILGEVVERLPVPPFGAVTTDGEEGDAEPVMIELALPTGLGPSITDVWSSLGVPPRASLELHAITRVQAREEVAGAPVEHLVLDVERRDTNGVRSASTTKIVRRWSTTKVDEHAPRD
jgi:hypothetical protein